MRLDKIVILAAISLVPQPSDATFGLLKEVASHIFGGIFGSNHHNQLPTEVPQVVPPAPPVVINKIQNTVQTTTTIMNQVPQTVMNQIINVYPQPVPMIQQIIIQLSGLVVLNDASWTDAVQTFCTQFSATNQIQLQPVQVVTIAQQLLPCFPVGNPSHVVFQNICNLKFPDPNQVITVQPPPPAATINNSLDPIFTDQGLSIAGSIIPMTTITSACQQFNIQQPVFTTLIQSCARLHYPSNRRLELGDSSDRNDSRHSFNSGCTNWWDGVALFYKGDSIPSATDSLAVVANSDYQPPVVAYQPLPVVVPSYQPPVVPVPTQQTYQAPDVQHMTQTQVGQSAVVQQPVAQQQIVQPQVIQQQQEVQVQQQTQVYQTPAQVYQQERQMYQTQQPVYKQEQVTPPAVDVAQDVCQELQQVQVALK
ncbi:hypothetical protein HDU81_005692 [Chytriomyces hyalinus]|nr:hypothetical protein HDU81_005692 [Chytriomyces hyalinus]